MSLYDVLVMVSMVVALTWAIFEIVMLIRESRRR